MRLDEAAAAAALHRLNVAREGLDDEAGRAETEIRRLSQETDRHGADLTREKSLTRDADDAVDTLAREAAGLSEREAAERERLDAAKARLDAAVEAVRAAEIAFDEKSRESAEFDARRRAIAAAIDMGERRLQKTAAQIAQLTDEKSRIAPTPEQAAALEAATARFAAAEAAAQGAEAAFHRAEEERAGAEARGEALKTPRQKAEQSLSELRAERDALKRVLSSQADGDWAPLIQSVTVEPGFENALAAALGDDLFAALDGAAPAHWSGHGALDGARALPAGAEPLSRFVSAPGALGLRLLMIGVIDAEDGPALAAALTPGQRLVTRAGDLWRWDGFVRRAEAKTAAAIRLEQQNRPTRLEQDFAVAQERAAHAIDAHGAAQSAFARTQAAEREARALFTDARRSFDGARTKLSDLQRDHARATSRLASIADAFALAQAERGENEGELGAAQSERAALPDPANIAEALACARDAASRARAEGTEARAAHNDLTREAQLRAQRLDEIAREKSVWTTRGETAANRTAEIAGRLEATASALGAAQDLPAQIEEKRGALLDQIGAAEMRRRDAGDTLAVAVSAAADADRAARTADAASAEAREARARLEAQSEAAVARAEEAALLAQETCNAAPEDLPAIAEFRDGAELPTRADVDAWLDRYKRERENLGGVNLRADEEMQDVSARLEELTREREDCDGAIRKLRAAIGALNREARERLNAAFETVNRNFSSLFTRLFNGGQAELRLIDSEDVLEAGLEIYASPPGKKLASMSLMSGGEQALTATAHIFAVFMANPAPVCVLDEVDAPLDDANTERFCRLLEEMAKETKTRFLIITHSALTMSRMSRLFGVTMVERGVSQLVSVDLNKAEQLAAAE